MKSFKEYVTEGLTEKDWQKDVADHKAGKADPEKLVKKWGERGNYFLSSAAKKK